MKTRSWREAASIPSPSPREVAATAGGARPQRIALQRVVYVVSQFPCLSETFIVREIDGLLAQGVDVRIVSLKADAGDRLPDGSEGLRDRAWHPQSTGTALAAVAQAIAHDPVAVVRGVAAIVADGWSRPGVMLKSLAALYRGLEQVPRLRQFAPQLIHAHWATYPATVAWVLGMLLDVPFGFTCHAHDIFVERQLLARKIRHAALAVTISRFNVEWLRQHVAPEAPGKFRIVHCGVDLARNAWRPDGRDPATLVAVGRLDPIKGFDVLVEAMALLRDDGIDIRCRLIGAGPLEQSLRSLAAARGVATCIDFAGAQPQSVVRQALDHATAFVLPSQVTADGNRDGIPVALMEAMASGCPVIGTRVSGIPELVEDGVNGLLVESRDPQALADAIARLLRDPGLRRQYAVQARARIEDQFDARTEALRMHAYMTGVINAA